MKKHLDTAADEERHYIRVIRLSLKEVIKTDLAQFEGDGLVEVFRIVQDEARRGIIDLSRVDFGRHWPKEYGKPKDVAARLEQKGLILIDDKRIELIETAKAKPAARGHGPKKEAGN